MARVHQACANYGPGMVRYLVALALHAAKATGTLGVSGNQRHPSTEAKDVTHQAEPASPIRRNRVTHQPEPKRHASGGTTQLYGAAVKVRLTCYALASPDALHIDVYCVAF
jgi:hypothetical protein